jgi:hypothetical protein
MPTQDKPDAPKCYGTHEERPVMIDTFPTNCFISLLKFTLVLDCHYLLRIGGDMRRAWPISVAFHPFLHASKVGWNRAPNGGLRPGEILPKIRWSLEIDLV